MASTDLVTNRYQQCKAREAKQKENIEKAVECFDVVLVESKNFLTFLERQANFLTLSAPAKS